MAPSLLLLASVAASAFAAPFPIRTDQPGARFDGIGHISGGGATSRLLFSYPDEQLNDILDFLFLPNFGLSTQHLKVEIGGDGQSSEGTEPSHQHTADDLNYARGYEWRLMQEAKARNPSILLSALAWVWPGWVGAGKSSPWTDNALSVAYVVSWLKGARDTYNLTIDYVNADWNERGWSADFVKALRAALDSAGFASTHIVCGDDAHSYACAASLPGDAALAAAVYALGSHNPRTGAGSPPPTVGKPLWGSELEVSDSGGVDTPTTIARLYLDGNVTGFVFWNLLTAYYEGLFAWDQGAFLAHAPWAGYYALSGRVWAVAHYTQHTSPGWRLLRAGAGSGALPGGGGSFISFVDPDGASDLTLVVHKPASDTGGPEALSFAISGPAAGATALHAWRSTLQSGPGADLSGYYLAQPDVAVAGGAFTLTVAPGELWTLSTRATGLKGARPAPPALTPFPIPYADTFDGCPASQEAPYWTDQTGVWECVPSGDPARGTVMRQMVPAHPVAWRPDEQRPFSIIGDITWAAADVAIDVNLPAAGDAALLGVRANPNCCGRLITGEDMMPGLWLKVAAGDPGFTVYGAIQNVSVAGRALLQGALPTTPTAGAWHRLRLVVTAGGSASAFLDGAPVFAAFDAAAHGVPATGFAGIGTGDWGQFVLFDNVTLAAAS